MSCQRFAEQRIVPSHGSTRANALRGPVLITAGGTGGHVFPALAVADCLRENGFGVVWLGVARGFEETIVQRAGIEFFGISGGGLRGKGLLRWAVAPVKLLRSLLEAFSVLRASHPCMVLGMGGFASGPGGIAARVARIPLVIHEQNAVPGLTNKILARIATRVLEAFPNSFPAKRTALHTGNPIRADIRSVPSPDTRAGEHEKTVRVLVLGGSQGARALNQILPRALAALSEEFDLQVRHQCGPKHLQNTREIYAHAGFSVDPEPFIEDMAQAYGWADVAVCRAGAMTVAELSAVGLPSILIPYPYAVDDHQSKNAAYLREAGAALCIDESSLDSDTLQRMLRPLLESTEKRLRMSRGARSVARPDAAQAVARICMEVANG